MNIPVWEDDHRGSLILLCFATGVHMYFNFIGCLTPPKPENALTFEEEAKAQKALATRNRKREQNKLRMRRVREAQRAAKEAEQGTLPAY